MRSTLERERVDFSDILEPFDVRPMLREHGTTEWVDLNLPNNPTNSGSFKP